MKSSNKQSNSIAQTRITSLGYMSQKR